jgi:hypothetical protein
METELFDRYVHEVGRRLPKRQRADVEAELHSLLMDALQDRLPEGEDVEAAPDEDQVAVLEELGPPAEMAARYRPPHHYVVGPRLYTVYWIVAAAMAGGLAVAHAIMFLLALWGDAESLGTFGEIVGNWVGAVLAGFGATTLAFFILERVLPQTALDELGEEKEWDPRALPPVEDRSRIELGNVIAEMVLTAIALVVFNFFPQWVGINFQASIDNAPSRWVSIPLLAPIFFARYLPLLNVQWIARLVLDAVLLRQGRWRRLTRLADFLLALFGVYIVSRMLFGPPLLTVEEIRSASLRETLESILFPLIRVALGLGLFGSLIESVQKLVRLLRAEGVSVQGRLADESADR